MGPGGSKAARARSGPHRLLPAFPFFSPLAGEDRGGFFHCGGPLLRSFCSSWPAIHCPCRVSARPLEPAAAPAPGRAGGGMSRSTRRLASALSFLSNPTLTDSCCRCILLLFFCLRRGTPRPCAPRFLQALSAPMAVQRVSSPGQKVAATPAAGRWCRTAGMAWVMPLQPLGTGRRPCGGMEHLTRQFAHCFPRSARSSRCLNASELRFWSRTATMSHPIPSTRR